MMLRIRSLFTGAIGTLLCAATAHAGSVVINEIRIDQTSTDNQEYFELKGPASTDLTGLTLIVIGDGTGGSGVIEAVVDLTGILIPADGHLLVAESSFNTGLNPFPAVTPDVITSLNFENSDNVTFILVSGFTGANGNDLDTDNDGVLDVTPWSSIVDLIAVIEEANPPASTEFHYGPPSIGPEPGTSFLPGHVYRCETDGTWTIGHFELEAPGSVVETPGSANPDCGLLPGTCGDVGAGNCFEANLGPGANPACNDELCCQTICMDDPFCCDVDWDAACAQAADFTCPGGDICGAPGSGSCFEVHITPGCNDADCCTAVCTIDPFCCDTSWDSDCVNLAVANCLPPPGDWIINEIHADPADTVQGGDANGDGVRDTVQDEFLEIYNNSGFAQDITGWTISDLAQLRYTFGNTIVPADCVVVIFGGGTPTGDFGSAVVRAVGTNDGLSLNNAGDTITFADSFFNIQTQVTYGSNAGNNVSITREPSLIGPFVPHPTAGNPDNGNAWSPGRTFSGAQFPGCNLVDTDGDTVPDIFDNCPTIPNFNQADCNNDGMGDACEVDANNNNVPDECEIVPPAGLVISEIRTDEPSTDNNEYFELRSVNPNTSLDQITYLVLGDGISAQQSGVIEAVVTLTGSSTDGGGYFVVAESTFALGIANKTADLNFENGDTVTHMLVANFYGSLGQDLDTNDDGVLDITPWLSQLDAVSLLDETVPDPPTGHEHPYGTPVGPEILAGKPPIEVAPGHVYRCNPDDDWTIGNFDPFDIIDPPTDTPGSDNIPCGAGPSCPGDLTDAQGGGPDGQINVFDLFRVLSAWGPCIGCPEDLTNAAGTGPDDQVNVFDLFLLLSGWGPCP